MIRYPTASLAALAAFALGAGPALGEPKVELPIYWTNSTEQINKECAARWGIDYSMQEACRVVNMKAFIKFQKAYQPTDREGDEGKMMLYCMLKTANGEFANWPLAVLCVENQHKSLGNLKRADEQLKAINAKKAKPAEAE